MGMKTHGNSGNLNVQKKTFCTSMSEFTRVPVKEMPSKTKSSLHVLTENIIYRAPHEKSNHNT